MTGLGLPASDSRIFWCIGLYASGSTWLFNAGKKIADASGKSAGLASAFVTTQKELVFPPGTATAIVKTHEIDETAADILMAPGDLVVTPRSARLYYITHDVSKVFL
jgi:hypothetical protein